MPRGSIISLGHKNPSFAPMVDDETNHHSNATKIERIEIGMNPGGTETPQAKDQAPTELKANLNLVHAVSLAVGQTIGSGIFVSPNIVVQKVGSVGMSLVIWVLSGVLSMCGALTFCELGTMFKRSGGEYQYVKAAYGRLPSFLYLWVCGIIRNGMGCAAIALTFAQYFCGLFIDDDSPSYTFVKKISASLAIVIIVLVNIYSTKIGIYMQNVFTALKLTALSVLVGMGMYELATGNTGSLGDGFTGTIVNIGTWSDAFFAALWSYSGWNCINMMAGEIKKPTKTVPRALVLTNCIMITIYLVANISYHIILTNEKLVESNAIAMDVGREMLGRHGTSWGNIGSGFFGLSVAISTFGALSSSLMGSSRLPFIAAQEGMFPRFIALIQRKNETPIVGLLFMGTLATVWCWPGNIGELIKYVGFLSWAWWGLCFASVPGMRFTKPNHPRAFKVFLLFPALACTFSLYLIVAPFLETPIPCTIWIGVMMIGIPLYYGFVDDRNKCDGWMEITLAKLSKWLRADL